MPAGAPPATPTLASASSIPCHTRCQSSRTTRSPRVHPDALTFAIRQTDRSDPRRPTSSSHAPWLNPHSACGSAGAPPTAISCLGAFWTPAASVGGGARHRRRPKTCTKPDLLSSQIGMRRLHHRSHPGRESLDLRPLWVIGYGHEIKAIARERKCVCLAHRSTFEL